MKTIQSTHSRKKKNRIEKNRKLKKQKRKEKCFLFSFFEKQKTNNKNKINNKSRKEEKNQRRTNQPLFYLQQKESNPYPPQFSS